MLTAERLRRRAEWVPVTTYAELVEVAGDGLALVRTWNGRRWDYRIPLGGRVTAVTRRRAEQGYRIGARTEVRRINP